MRGVINSGDVLGVMPPHCSELSPPFANAWSDGSVSNPAQSNFRLGGTAVWHSRRNERDNPTTDFEKDIATARFTNDGGEVLHVYRGHDVDSYRTEVIGIILAMGRNGGLNWLLGNFSAM